MTFFKVVQQVENRFWKTFISLLSHEGKIMRGIRTRKQANHRQGRNIGFLIIIWAAIGFVSGMLIGRILLIFHVL
jgi:hypothetical protein